MSLIPLDAACSTRNLNMVEDVIGSGSKPGPHTLAWAINSTNSKIVELVVRAGAPAAPDSLSRACLTKDIGIFNWVLMAGGRPDKDTYTNALQSKNAELVQRVEELGGKRFAEEEAEIQQLDAFCRNRFLDQTLALVHENRDMLKEVLQKLEAITEFPDGTDPSRFKTLALALTSKPEQSLQTLEEAFKKIAGDKATLFRRLPSIKSIIDELKINATIGEKVNQRIEDLL